MESLTVKDIIGNDSKSVKSNQQVEESVPFLGPTIIVNNSEVQNVPEPANLVRRKYLTFEYLTENIYQYSHIKCYKLSVNG